jgi:hypothetical protein
VKRRPNYRRIVALERELGFGPQREGWVEADVLPYEGEIDWHALRGESARRVLCPWSEPWPCIGALIGASSASAFTLSMAPGSTWPIESTNFVQLWREALTA